MGDARQFAMLLAQQNRTKRTATYTCHHCIHSLIPELCD